MMAAGQKTGTQGEFMSAVSTPDDLYGLLARAGESHTYSDGEVIFQQGDPGDSMYIVNVGAVALKAGELVIETVSAPGLFGEMALIESQPRSLSAVAEGDAELVSIPARHFWVLVHETPYFAQLVMSVMAARLRQAGETT
jgi:CRP/FNR family transcriptional regulator, cyclic AMP receptor protein